MAYNIPSSSPYAPSNQSEYTQALKAAYSEQVEIALRALQTESAQTPSLNPADVVLISAPLQTEPQLPAASTPVSLPSHAAGYCNAAPMALESSSNSAPDVRFLTDDSAPPLPAPLPHPEDATALRYQLRPPIPFDLKKPLCPVQ